MRIVDMVHEDLRLSKILTKEAFENAIKVNAALKNGLKAVSQQWLACHGQHGSSHRVVNQPQCVQQLLLLTWFMKIYVFPKS
jgi:hypothetical protein